MRSWTAAATIIGLIGKKATALETLNLQKPNFIKVRKHLRLGDLWKRHLTIFQFDGVLEPATQYFIRQMLQLL